MDNITFDLETLGKKTDAAIVQLGAVKFTDEGKILSKFQVSIDMNSFEDMDFSICYSTIEWWLQQSQEARESVFEANDKECINQALVEFSEWCRDNNVQDCMFWSHKDFDPAKLEHAYDVVGSLYPLKDYFRQMDIRTLTHVCGLCDDVKYQGVHHNALSDCLYQAEYISIRLKKLKSLGLEF